MKSILLLSFLLYFLSIFSQERKKKFDVVFVVDSVLDNVSAIPVIVTFNEFDSLLLINHPFHISKNHSLIDFYIAEEMVDLQIQENMDTVPLLPDWFEGKKCQYYLDSTLMEEWMYTYNTYYDEKIYYYRNFRKDKSIISYQIITPYKSRKVCYKNDVVKKLGKKDKGKIKPLDKSEGVLTSQKLSIQNPIRWQEIDTIEFYDYDSFYRRGNCSECQINKKPISDSLCEKYCLAHWNYSKISRRELDCENKNCLAYTKHYSLDGQLLYETYENSREGPNFGSYISYHSNGNIKTKGQYYTPKDCYDIIYPAYFWSKPIGVWQNFNKKGKLKKTYEYDNS